MVENSFRMMIEPWSGSSSSISAHYGIIVRFWTRFVIDDRNQYLRRLCQALLQDS
jgi:hypothetical protein